MREFSAIASNWRSGESAQNYLVRNNIPVLWDIDTRALVLHIRKMGAFFMVVQGEQSPGAGAKSFSIPASPDIRKFSPIRVTPARLSA